MKQEWVVRLAYSPEELVKILNGDEHFYIFAITETCDAEGNSVYSIIGYTEEDNVDTTD